MTSSRSRAVYFDTSLITTATFQPIVEHHSAAVRFCDQLIQQAATIHFSHLMQLEYAQALRSLAMSVDDVTRRRFRLHHWDRADTRRRWLEYGNGRLAVFLSQFDWFEAVISREVLNNARDLMVTCNLSSYDAAHVATALSLGITELAAVDSHFERASHLLTVHTIRSTPADS